MVITKEKSYCIQMLRGLAIIAVVFIHNTPGGAPQVFCRPFMNFSVGLFLFLSGMLSTAEKWKPWKRIKKVLIPYLIWTAIYVILYNYKTPALIPKIFITDLIEGNAAATFYYIFVYIELTLLIPLIGKLAKSKFMYLGFVISPIEIIIMRLIPQIIGYEMNEYIRIAMSISCIGWFSYFYLGYLLGNGIIKVNFSKVKLSVMLCIAFLLQVAEGYWYYLLGNQNCGTQLKLTSVLTGCIVCIIAFRFIESEKFHENKLLYLLGDCSFGIYFSHIAIMYMLSRIPKYGEFIIFPLNAIVTLFTSCVFVMIGKRVLGKYSKYLAL